MAIPATGALSSEPSLIPKITSVCKENKRHNWFQFQTESINSTIDALLDNAQAIEKAESKKTLNLQTVIQQKTPFLYQVRFLTKSYHDVLL